MNAYKWRVEGEQLVSGNIERDYEDTGVIESEGMGEAIQQLIDRELWWDTLDTEREVSIIITPISCPVA